MRVRVGMFSALLLTSVSAEAAPAAPRAIQSNRTFETLPPAFSEAELRVSYARAAALLGGRSVLLAEVRVDGPTISAALAEPDEPLTRALRETLRRPVDPEDLLYFLDDVILAIEGGVEGELIIPAGRARHVGVFVHPHDVFRPEKARVYGVEPGSIPVDRPPEQSGLTPAVDGEVLGPRWTARYLQPASEEARLVALERVNLSFGSRVRQLVDGLKASGALVFVESTLRDPRRGYLIYGAYLLSRADNARDVSRGLRRLARFNKKWGLNVPIRWRHPRGWRATREAARLMADTYGVDYATSGGARRSDHYDGRAVDLYAVDLPRKLTLTAPDGATETFDLSGPDEPRDLNLSLQLIEWIEAHFGFEKLRSDYPHWGDSAPAPPKTARPLRSGPEP